MASHPRVASSLIAHIPRLDLVAQMIARQFDTLPPAPPGPDGLASEAPAIVGARLLQLATAFDEALMRGSGDRAAVAELRTRARFPPEMIDALDTFVALQVESRVKEVGLKDLNTVMVLDQDVRSRAGLLLVSKGQPVTVAVIQRLRTFAQGIGVREPFRVRIPADARAAARPARGAV